MIRDLIAMFESDADDKFQPLVDAFTNGIKDLLDFIYGKLAEALK